MTNYITNSQDNKTITTVQTTADKVLAALEAMPGIEVEEKGKGTYRLSGTPWRNGSDSSALALEIAPDGEHGKYYDHVTDEGGSLYEFAEQIGVEIPKPEDDQTAYDYHDENGKLVMQVVRYYDKQGKKKFFQRQPDGKGDWINSTSKPPVKRPPYRLPDLLPLPPGSLICICEGEKDVDTARRMGLAATCNPGGAGKWKTIHSSYNLVFKGHHLAIIPDNDEAGIPHATDVAQRFPSIAASVKVLAPLGEGEGYDLTDWANDGGKHLDLLEIVKETPEYQPGLKDMPTRIKEAGVTILTPDGIKTTQISTWADIDEILGPIEWEWSGWLAKGFQTLAASMSGEGKSYLLLRVAATYLQGLPWPDGTPFEGETGKVLWCETEAAQALNLGRAKGLKLCLTDLINPLENPLEDIDLSDPTHRAAIESAAQRDDIKLIVIDSLSGGTTGRDNKNSGDMLVIGKWLAELARDTNKPVLVSHHLRKKSIFDGDKINLDRLRDSSSIAQTARIIWAIDAPDYEYPEQKRLYVIKSNLGRFPEPVGFEIDDSNHVEFGEAPEAPREETQQDKAIDLLKTLLAGGPARMVEIEKDAQGAGISMNTIRRAKGKLNIVTRKTPDGWYWSLPARD